MYFLATEKGEYLHHKSPTIHRESVLSKIKKKCICFIESGHLNDAI